MERFLSIRDGRVHVGVANRAAVGWLASRTDERGVLGGASSIRRSAMVVFFFFVLY
jgi:hypothetical protein